MNILISGGTGLVGKHLTKLLQKKGHQVAVLSRTKQTHIESFVWDIPSQTMDKQALIWADAIVHLAGAGVAEKNWTQARKKEILDSRILSSRLLAKNTADLPTEQRPTIFVGASAIGYYGLDTGEALLTEASPAGKEFLADVTVKWEQENSAFTALGLRTSLWRIGVVLAKEGGALPTMSSPIQWGVGSPLGSGKQYLSWIHIQDMARMMVYAIENEAINGIYNACAPSPATNSELTKAIAKTLGKPSFFPHVPAFVLKIILGEMADMVLGGNKVSCQKIQEAGFTFDFPELLPALENLLKAR
jgi:hypothetical protein